jgi:hypothetical protein
MDLGKRAGATLILATTNKGTLGGRFLEAYRRGYLGGTVNGTNVTHILDENNEKKNVLDIAVYY